MTQPCPRATTKAVARASQSIAHRCGLPAKVAEETILTSDVRIFLTGIKGIFVGVAATNFLHVGRVRRIAVHRQHGRPHGKAALLYKLYGLWVHQTLF